MVLQLKRTRKAKFTGSLETQIKFLFIFISFALFSALIPEISWAQSTLKNVQIYTNRPNNAYTLGSAQRVIFAIHGSSRNASKARDNFVSALSTITSSSKVLIIAPYFSETGRTTTFGWSGGNWRYGALSDNSIGGRRMSSFHWVQEVAQELLAQNPSLTFLVAGHSAGGQFASRFPASLAAFPGISPCRFSVLSQNAGTYAQYNSPQYSWHYTFNNLPSYLTFNRETSQTLGTARIVATSLSLANIFRMVGSLDTLSDDLDTSRAAMAFGANRLLRAQIADSNIRQAFTVAGVSPRNYDFAVATGLGHDSDQAAVHSVSRQFLKRYFNSTACTNTTPPQKTISPTIPPTAPPPPKGTPQIGTPTRTPTPRPTTVPTPPRTPTPTPIPNCVQQVRSVYSRFKPVTEWWGAQLNNLGETTVLAQLVAATLGATLPDASSFTTLLFNESVGRFPQGGDLAPWLEYLAKGGNRTDLAAFALQHPGESRYVMARRAFVRTLRRSARPEEQTVWGNYMASAGLPEPKNHFAQMLAYLISTPEYWDQAGGTSKGFMERMWQDIFARNSGTGEIDFHLQHTPEIAGNYPLISNRTSGAAARQSIAFFLLLSPEGRQINISWWLADVVGVAPGFPARFAPEACLQ